MYTYVAIYLPATKSNLKVNKPIIPTDNKTHSYYSLMTSLNHQDFPTPSQSHSQTSPCRRSHR